MELEIIRTLLQCIERYPEGSENKKWYTKLFQDSLEGTTNPSTDIELVNNATGMDNILSTLLAIDIKTVVKIRMVHKVIVTAWEERGWNIDYLNSYVLNEKPSLPNTIPLANFKTNEVIMDETQEISPMSQYTQQPMLQHIQQPQAIQNIEETNIEEIIMTESDEKEATNSGPEIQPSMSKQSISTNLNDVIGKNIATIQRYELRNRSFDPKNPFNITKNQKIRIGALIIDIPGENEKEQLAFMANTLRLPAKSNLVQAEFRNGNRWISAGFDYEEDLEFCLNKFKNKEDKIVDLIRLTTRKEERKLVNPPTTTSIKGTQSAQLENNKHIYSQQPTKNKTVIGSISNINYVNQTKEKGKEKENQYRISNGKTKFKGGFLASTIPGKNRKEQLDYIIKILILDKNNECIYPVFHKGNSWIIIYFDSSNDLEYCIEDINTKYGSAIQIINLSEGKSEKETTEELDSHNSFNKGQQHQISRSSNEHAQTYKILDIPKEYSNKRIRGALKPYGEIMELKIFDSKKKQEKEVQITLKRTPISKDLSDSWSIPIGSIMARIAPKDACHEVWQDRNQYVARLYGIPRGTNAVLLMRAIKNLKPKTCYIPKCSISKKERSFAIISFQTKKDLNKACASAARYYNFILTWSKSKTQHINSMTTRLENGCNYDSTKERFPKSLEKIHSEQSSKQNHYRRNSLSSMSTLSFMTITPPASVSEEEVRQQEVQGQEVNGRTVYNKKQTIKERKNKRKTT